MQVSTLNWTLGTKNWSERRSKLASCSLQKLLFNCLWIQLLVFLHTESATAFQCSAALSLCLFQPSVRIYCPLFSSSLPHLTLLEYFFFQFSPLLVNNIRSVWFHFFYACKQFLHLVDHIGFCLWQERFKVSVHHVRPCPVWECWLIAILMTKYAFIRSMTFFSHISILKRIELMLFEYF